MQLHFSWSDQDPSRTAKIVQDLWEKHAAHCYNDFSRQESGTLESAKMDRVRDVGSFDGALEHPRVLGLDLETMGQPALQTRDAHWQVRHLTPAL